MTHPILLTDRQRQVACAILAHQRTHGTFPTIRQLCAAIGTRYTNGMACVLEALRRKGLLKPADGRHANGRLRGVAWLPQFDDSPAGVLLAELYREITGEKSALFQVPREVLG